MKRNNKTQITKELLIAVAVVLIAIVFTGVVNIRTVQETRSSLSIPVNVEPIAVEANSRILLLGEVFWGRYIRDASAKSELGNSFPFSGLNTFNREKYDAWFAHMECPITDNNLTSAQQEATLTFNCRPEFLSEAAKWFDVMTLANNHTDNMGGQAGLDETRANLEASGIQHYGHYSNEVLDELCEVVNLPMRVNYLFGEETTEQFPVVMCGYHGVFALPTSEQIDVIREYSKYFLTIVTPQMGQEYVPAADRFKTNTYRAMIDRGADMVVASHPHWVQNTEVYKGKLIMYSIGNFIFDQQFEEEVRRGAALDLQITIEDSQQLQQWLEAGLDCDAFGDDCLELARELKLDKPAFVLNYDIVSSLNTRYVTSLAPSDVHQRVLQRLNWEQTVSNLLN